MTETPAGGQVATAAPSAWIEGVGRDGEDVVQGASMSWGHGGE